MRSSPNTVRAGALAVCLAIAPVVTACGSDDDAAPTTPASETTATAGPATTTTATTTTAPATSTTTDPPDTTASSTTTTTTTNDTDSLASGSGCTPGAGALPDGEWFGFVADASAGGIEFDLACWFDGDAAIAATAADGEESPPPNDYYVRNSNPALRTIPVADDAEVRWVPDVGTPTSATIGYPDWLLAREDRGIDLQPGVWITVTGGDIAGIEEQWVP